MPLTLLDIILLTVMLISAILAMVRGFMREVLSIASWIAAAAVTLYAYPKLVPTAKQYVSNEMVATGIVVAGVFLATLLVVSVITIKISDMILDSRVGALDRTLGFLFGLARGLLIVVVAFLFFAWLVPERSWPDWVRNAKSAVVLQSTGQALMSMMPEDPEGYLRKFKRPKGEDEPPDAAPPADTAPPKQGAADDQPSYVRGDRIGMQRLLNSTASKTR